MIIKIMQYVNDFPMTQKVLMNRADQELILSVHDGSIKRVKQKSSMTIDI